MEFTIKNVNINIIDGVQATNGISVGTGNHGTLFPPKMLRQPKKLTHAASIEFRAAFVRDKFMQREFP